MRPMMIRVLTILFMLVAGGSTVVAPAHAAPAQTEFIQALGDKVRCVEISILHPVNFGQVSMRLSFLL